MRSQQADMLAVTRSCFRSLFALELCFWLVHSAYLGRIRCTDWPSGSHEGAD